MTDNQQLWKEYQSLKQQFTKIEHYYKFAEYHVDEQSGVKLFWHNGGFHGSWGNVSEETVVAAQKMLELSKELNRREGAGIV